MRIGLVIADFEMHFGSSFKHTARVKYGVDFNNSNISEIVEKLNLLKQNMEAGISNTVPVVGWDFSITDVEHVTTLLNEIVQKYKELFSPTIPSNKKLYTLCEQLRQAVAPAAEELAVDVVKQIISPQQPKKLTRKKQLDADAEQKSRERALEMIRKKSAKND